MFCSLGILTTLLSCQEIWLSNLYIVNSLLRNMDYTTQKNPYCIFVFVHICNTTPKFKEF